MRKDNVTTTATQPTKHMVIEKDEYYSMKRKLEASEARIAELERVLRMAEFVPDEGDLQKCPWCFIRTYGHEHFPDCPRQRVLGE